MIKLEKKVWAGHGARMENFSRNNQKKWNLEDHDVDGRIFLVRVLEKYCVTILCIYTLSVGLVQAMYLG
jgi:hypothetical protein